MFHTFSRVCFCILYHNSRNGNNSLLWPVVQGLSKILGQSSGMSSQKQNKEKLWCQYFSANTVFKVQPPRSPRLTPLDFHLCRHNSRVFSCNWKWRGISPIHFLLIKPFTTSPGPLKECDIPWTNVPIHAFIQVEHILSILYEQWLDKKQGINTS